MKKYRIKFTVADGSRVYLTDMHRHQDGKKWQILFLPETELAVNRDYIMQEIVGKWAFDWTFTWAGPLGTIDPDRPKRPLVLPITGVQFELASIPLDPFAYFTGHYKRAFALEFFRDEIDSCSNGNDDFDIEARKLILRAAGELKQSKLMGLIAE